MHLPVLEGLLCKKNRPNVDVNFFEGWKSRHVSEIARAGVKPNFLLGVLVLFAFAGCATSAGVKESPPQYDPKTGTYRKTYTTGELGSHFVKDLLGIGNR
jgi:hypothetical protein